MIGIFVKLRGESNLGKLVILPVLSLLIHEHGISLQLFRSLLSTCFEFFLLAFILFFLAMAVACGSSRARDRTHTMQRPEPQQ